MAIDDNTSYELTGYQVKDLAQKIRAKADLNSLASVATSGLYSDLTGAPTIPTVYNGTLTIQQNGTTLGTFSANQDTNETINITGGGSSSATVTTFYLTSLLDGTKSLYKDFGSTQPATYADFSGAIDDTETIVKIYDTDGDDQYVVIAGEGGVAKLYKPFGNSFYEIRHSGSSNTIYIEHIDIQERLTAGSNITIDSSTNTISATDTTYSNFTGATSSVAGTNGLVPAPAAGDEGKALHGDGTWKETTAKLVEMSYGEANSWAKFIAAYNAGSIVYCRASSNANPATGSQTRKAFMAYVNNATSPTSVEFQYVRSQSSKTAAQQFDQVFVYKLTNSNGGTWTVESRDMGPKIVAGTGMSSSFTTGANATITLNAEPNYSTSEVDTNVKWVDGKTIYRKTIDFGALPNATTKTVAHGISNLHRVVKIECLAYNPTNDTNTPLPLVSVVGNNSTMDINDTSIVMITGVDRSSYTECYVTLYYTKSS